MFEDTQIVVVNGRREDKSGWAPVAVGLWDGPGERPRVLELGAEMLAGTDVCEWCDVADVDHGDEEIAQMQEYHPEVWVLRREHDGFVLAFAYRCDPEGGIVVGDVNEDGSVR